MTFCFRYRVCYFLLSLLLSASLAQAEDLPIDGFHHTVEAQRIFKDVQMVRVDERFGLHAEEDLRLNRWIGVAPEATVGVDAKGRVVAVLQLSDRLVARNLSGQVPMREVFLSLQGDLLAIAQDGRVHTFSWPLWQSSPTRGVAKRVIASFAVGLCALVGGGAVLNASCELSGLDMLAGLAMGSVSASMYSAWLGLLHFERNNDSATGFVATDLVWPNLRVNSLKVLGEDSFDYELQGPGGEFSLLAAVVGIKRQPGQSFAVTCADELLPRGVPERLYSGVAR
jgi:hypothetical protein